MNASILLLTLSFLSNSLFCGTALDAFKSLVLANKAKQTVTTTSSPLPTATKSDEAYYSTAETTEEAGTSVIHTDSTNTEKPQEGQPKLPQFRQRGESKAVTLKQVDGANNGGAASTPSKNLAAWYSEDLYDTPTKASWLQDDNYDPNAIADGFAALKKTSGPATQKPTPKSSTATGGRVLTPVGSGGAGAMMGGGGGASAQQVRAEDNFRQATMQQGRAQRDAADTGESEMLRKQQREEESRVRKARKAAHQAHQAALAARFRTTASARHTEGS